MVASGFGKFALAERIFALERITGEERGDGRRTRVWIDGVAEPLIASRTEVTILRDMGQESAVAAPELDEAMDLAARLAAAAEEGRVDLSDLGRRARRLLATTPTVVGTADWAWPAASLRNLPVSRKDATRQHPSGMGRWRDGPRRLWDHARDHTTPKSSISVSVPAS